MRVVITEADLRSFQGACEVMVPRGAIVTPAARDYAGERGIALVETDDQDWVSGEAASKEVPLEELMVRIARAAVLRLGPDLDREVLAEVLVSVISAALVRLGYAVVAAKGGEPKWPWKRWE